ncbi:MAG TPA: serine hydrolase domain-containing protein [Microvirga sp.]|jgi:CubicO group peptidase (beta-lactamase class C family)|nr:serine hydrolase domain-containing protein [Microvirga sp.]
MLRIAVVEEGRLVETRGAETPVPWWSFTKTVLAAAALALVRDGRLSLEAPLAGRPFTLRQLLQHRAGLPDYGGLAAYHAAVARGDAPWPFELILERTEARRLRYEPGRGWDYSNIGYRLVGDLVAEAVRLPLGEALRSLILDPLGVPRARLALRPEDLAGADFGTADSYHPGWVYHGLIVGPLAEAATLLHRLLAGPYLPAHLLAAMRAPHPLGGTVPGRPWRAPGYGLGLMAGETRYGWRVEGHTGGGPGSVCAVYHEPDRHPPRTVATFLPGERTGAVERAAMRFRSSQRGWAVPSTISRSEGAEPDRP